MKNQTTLKTALLIMVLAMMTACGQNKDAATSFSYQTPVNSAANGSLSMTNCNQKSQGGLTAKMMVYTDGANNVRNDYMKVMITQIPADFASGSFLEFFRWQASSNGQTYLDPNPVQARFETLGGQILTNFSPVIYWAQIAQIAQNSGFSDPNQFLQYVRLVVDIRDPQAQYDVLKIAMYNTSNAVTVNMDMLMPAFAASPVDYATDNGAARATSLQALHPFAGQNITAAQALTTLNTYCF